MNDAENQTLIKFRNDLIFNNQGGAIIAVFAVIAMIVHVFSGEIPAQILNLWAIICAISYLGRYAIYRAYQRADDNGKSLPIWERRFTISVAISGLIWGASVFMIVPVDSVIYQFTFLFIIVVLSITTTVTHAAYRRASALFVILSMGPFAAPLFFQSSEPHVAMGVLMVILLLLLVGLAGNLHRATLRAFSLRSEKEQLLDKLDHSNRELEVANNELNTALDNARDANQAKSLFLANMSHEIRTPLNGILGMAEVMRNTNLDEVQGFYLDTMERSGTTLLNLINELLDLSKIESGTLTIDSKPFESFRWLLDIQMLTEPLFEDRKTFFTTEMANDIPSWLRGDPSRLLQVIVNLVSNAAKFTESGEVKLSIGGERKGDSYRLRVDVTDTGIGIPQDKLAHIFESFHQLSSDRITNRGVGLGLTICDHLVTQMGGKLDVSSELGAGSHFWFELELPVAGESTTQSAADLPRHHAALKILLVDDDPVNRLAAGTLLNQGGHRVVEATNGREAIDALQSDGFDAILMDIHMPIMDGVEATRLIRVDENVRIANTPIIGLTASVMRDEKEHYLASGMNAVVEKPIVYRDLIETIVECVDGLHLGMAR